VRSDDDVWTRLVGLIQENFDAADVPVTADTVAADIDGWDSISHTYLILAIESHFAIALPEREVHDLADVGELYRLVRRLLEPRG
jgi:acyl carrier protein